MAAACLGVGLGPPRSGQTGEGGRAAQHGLTACAAPPAGRPAGSMRWPGRICMHACRILSMSEQGMYHPHHDYYGSVILIGDVGFYAQGTVNVQVACVFGA